MPSRWPAIHIISLYGIRNFPRLLNFLFLLLLLLLLLLVSGMCHDYYYYLLWLEFLLTFAMVLWPTLSGCLLVYEYVCVCVACIRLFAVNMICFVHIRDEHLILCSFYFTLTLSLGRFRMNAWCRAPSLLRALFEMDDNTFIYFCVFLFFFLLFYFALFLPLLWAIQTRLFFGGWWTRSWWEAKKVKVLV